jgi:hypothetical protein
MTELEKQAMELYSFPEARKAYIKGYQDANQWIDCKDRLPIDGSHVIGCCFDGGVREVRFHNIEYSITHWMPLPNKPLK